MGLRWEGAGSRWVQNKWPHVTDLTDESLGRLTDRVGPSGPLNETQPEEGGEWDRTAIESYFYPPASTHLLPLSERAQGTEPSPGCCRSR